MENKDREKDGEQEVIRGYEDAKKMMDKVNREVAELLKDDDIFLTEDKKQYIKVHTIFINL